jgi:hypothetical protein
MLHTVQEYLQPTQRIAVSVMIRLAVYGLQLVGTFLQNVLIVAAVCRIPKDLWLDAFCRWQDRLRRK